MVILTIRQFVDLVDGGKLPRALIPEDTLEDARQYAQIEKLISSYERSVLPVLTSLFGIGITSCFFVHPGHPFQPPVLIFVCSLVAYFIVAISALLFVSQKKREMPKTEAIFVLMEKVGSLEHFFRRSMSSMLDWSRQEFAAEAQKMLLVRISELAIKNKQVVVPLSGFDPILGAKQAFMRSVAFFGELNLLIG